MPCLALLPGTLVWGHRAESRCRACSPQHNPVNVCAVGKRSESTHCLHGSVCPPCPHPSRGPLGKFIFLGCTFISPIATKVPGPHWAWFLTSRPPSSSRFPHCTPQELFLSLLASHPVFHLSPFLGFLLADSFCSPISDLASASPVPPIFPQQLFHFIHSLIGQIVAETC